MDFRTELVLKPSHLKIGLKDNILTAGSCFAQSMGDKFSENKFNALINPFGTIYNPLSIFTSLQYGATHVFPMEETYLERDGVYYNYDFHSSFSSTDLPELKQHIEQRIGLLDNRLTECDVLILTLGTGFVYERKDNGFIVSNCHKMPSSLFTRRLLSVAEIVDSFSQTIEMLVGRYPAIKIILTVSPVRHTRDTLPLNNLSKSVLRVACDEIVEKHVQVEYFPAYEIMMDDLRDYRFYKDDLIHPTEAAENYIWEKFSTAHITDASRLLMKKWNEVRKALAHKPFQADSESHKKFLSDLLLKLEELKPSIDVEQEIKQVHAQLA